MILKHMQVQYNRMPDRPATLYYACGKQDGKMYESHVVVNDAETITKTREQIDKYVTQKLQQGIRELTIQEQQQREQEMKGAILC